MKWLFQSLNSSIGKKIMMGLTGLFLIIFLTGHLSGNFALFANDGGESFNNYAKFLKSLPGLKFIEIGLAVIFILHACNGIWLYIQNKKAKPIGYAVNASSKNSTFSSRTMAVTGSITFAFLVIHLRNFWYEYVIVKSSDNLYEIVVETLSDPIYGTFYIIAMLVLGFHLNHGFQSAFQTFGWNHKKYTPIVNFLGKFYTVLITLGFISMPVYFLFFYGGN
ncbi:MAG: succinate dehydrogenase cytochrome b subunit [Rhodothermaceae bacterium]